MPNSLRCKLKKLKHQGLLTDKDCERLTTALDKAEKPKAKWTMITFDIGDFKSRDGETYELSITSARCSNCERYSTVLQQYRPIPTRYCPHCGAEMEVNK